MANYNSKLQSNNTDLQGILNTINALPDAGGVELPELTNPAIESEVFLNKEIIDEQGNVKTGTFTIENELSNQGNLIAQLQTMVDELPEAGEQIAPEISINASNGLITATVGNTTSTYQMAFQGAKTITPGTISQVAISSGHYAGGSVTVAAVPTQSKSVTPTSSAQNIVPDSGKFLSKVMVNGDSNLVASNIKSGISIFGVNGTLQEGSGSGEASEWSENEDAMITGTLSVYSNDRVKSINSHAFYSRSNLISVNFPACTLIEKDAFAHCSSLASVNFPLVTTIGNYAFCSCSSLTSVNSPLVTTIGNNAFDGCESLASANFPLVTTMGKYAFDNCSSLTSVNFPLLTIIHGNTFQNCVNIITASFPLVSALSGGWNFYECSNLTTLNFSSVLYINMYKVFARCYVLSNLTLGASQRCYLAYSDAFTSTPFAGYSSYFSGTPHIYVPASLVSAYQKATNWTYFSSYFSSIESLENN